MYRLAAAVRREELRYLQKLEEMGVDDQTGKQNIIAVQRKWQKDEGHKLDLCLANDDTAVQPLQTDSREEPQSTKRMSHKQQVAKVRNFTLLGI